MRHKITILILALIFNLPFSISKASAQTIYVCHNGSYTETTLTNGLEINPAEVDSITFDVPQFGSPIVTITYEDNKASVSIPAFAPYITATVNGADVVINNAQTEGHEAIYSVSGKSDNGSLTINGQYKLTIQLDGLSLTSQKGAPIDIECGKRCAIILKEGTTNALEDAQSSTVKAALYSKGHIEFEGNGTLNVTGNANHAITSKEYFKMKSTAGTINILKSANDALHIGQYFQMSGGTININEDTTGDGIQVELTRDETDEYNGQIFLKGGIINATIAHEDCKAVKADGDITVSGGTYTLNANGNGSRGIQTAGNMVIGEENGTVNILVNATGGKCTLAADVDDPHKCTGIKVEGNLTINAGIITVNNTGKKAKGIKIGRTYTKNGGTVNAVVE